MCRVETETYTRADGSQFPVDTTYPCHRATGSRLCAHTERRNIDRARYVERQPASRRPEMKDTIVTVGRDGRQTVYRDVTRHSSRRSSHRPTTQASQRRSREGGPSSPTYPETKPRAPTPPPPPAAAAEGPWRPPLNRPSASTSSPNRTVARDGTAIYERPPSLELPRARDNERRARFVPRGDERQSSGSSTLPEPDAPATPPTPANAARRPSIRIRTSAGPSSTSSPTAVSPGLSQLPKVGNLRHDSAKDLPPPRTPDDQDERSWRQRIDDERIRRQQIEDERIRRQHLENQRQAQLERDRLAESDRRQEARRQEARRNAERAARDASRERRGRHHQEAAAALEGERRASNRQAQLEAELAQMERERISAERRRASLQAAATEADDQRRRESEARARSHEARASPRTSRRVVDDPYTSSPLSPRSPRYSGQGYGSSSARRGGERDDDFVAREPTPAERMYGPQWASRRFSATLNPEDLYETDVVFDLDEYYLYRDMAQTRDSRRARRDAYRAEQNERFWD